MHDLAPTTALAETRAARVVLGPVTLAENPGIALASVALRKGSDSLALENFLGQAAPDIASACFGPSCDAFWLGPDSWMLEAPDKSRVPLDQALRAALGAQASITDQTGAWARFDITGQRGPALFERLCNLDLHAAPTGLSRRSVIGHVGCQIVLRADRISVYVPRSYARDVFDTVITAARAAF